MTTWKQSLAAAALTASILAGCGTSGGSLTKGATTTTRKGDTTSSDPTSSSTTSSSTTSSTTTTTDPSVVPEPTIGEDFYQDDFSDDTKGWPQADDDSATYTLHADYAQPEYTVTIKKAGIAVLPHPEYRGISQDQLRDYGVSAEIQTTLSVGGDDWFGVMCRDLDHARYEFEMALDHNGDSSDAKRWAIVKDTPDGSSVLAKGTFSQGGSAFQVAGTCVGGQDGPAYLTMFVNGTAIGSVADTDSPLQAGYGGLYLDSSEGNSSYNVLDYRTVSAS